MWARRCKAELGYEPRVNDTAYKYEWGTIPGETRLRFLMNLPAKVRNEGALNFNSDEENGVEFFK